MNFKVIEKELPGVFVLTHDSYQDFRGKFSRLFCFSEFKQFLKKKTILQVNHSYTKNQGTVRGLHFQYKPCAEIKFIKVLKGSIFDVVLNLNTGKYCSEILSYENQKIIVIPEGYAHGFQTLEDEVEMLYLHSEFYNPKVEGGVNPFDPKINVTWPLQVSKCSDRDRNLPKFEEIQIL